VVKRELVKRIGALNPGLRAADCASIVDALFRTMAGHLTAGGRIELRGFGTFFPSELGNRRARNPRTGETFTSGGLRTVRFRSGQPMKARLNPEH
jgi:integration host factor subunit beta